MTGPELDPELLASLWDQQWPGRSKVPHRLRTMRGRWVRFHTLPESKRYPDSEDEYPILLARYNTVLDELVTDGQLIVMTPGYSNGPEPQVPGRELAVIGVHPVAVHWATVCLDDEPEFTSYLHLYASHIAWEPGCVDRLLRGVADNVIANVMLADSELRWLCHPYDGGIDVVMPSSRERDALRERHRDWLSSHPGGL